MQRWDRERIGDHVRPLDSLPSIRETAALWQAALQFEESEAPRLLVLSPAGLPCGTLAKGELAEAVLQRLGLRVPPENLAPGAPSPPIPRSWGAESRSAPPPIWGIWRGVPVQGS
ncbi:MAG: hypothetical protein ACK5N0_14625 [Synechococcaceae cyanobacterium]